MSLESFGVEAPDVVRAPVQDRHDDKIRACPECGRPVGDPTTVRIAGPDVVDDVEIGTLATRAYTCDGHAYDVVLPVTVGRDAQGLGPNWTSIRIRYADDRIRRVAIPKTEVSAA